jgi:cyanate lyase
MPNAYPYYSYPISNDKKNAYYFSYPSRNDLTSILLSAKRSKNFTFQDLADHIGGSKEWLAAVLYGQATMSKKESLKLTRLLDLSPTIAHLLEESPTRGSVNRTIPTDPLIYRFYEIMQVYGVPLKALINEMFGDGIMSALDLSIDVDKVPDPDDPSESRVVITFDGKFLPFKKI